MGANPIVVVISMVGTAIRTFFNRTIETELPVIVALGDIAFNCHRVFELNSVEDSDT